MVIEEHPAGISRFKAGHVLAGYRLEEKIGEGGMAVVYRAREQRLRRLVALKILATEFASDAAFRRRFIGESEAAAAVDHPHIIPVYDHGEADGVLFISMRYVAGGDLRHLMQRYGMMPPSRVAEIVSPVASALDAAHRAGLVHRDVKPGNILVDTGPGRPDHVLLSDFGVSKSVAASVNLTGTGQFIGTAGYSAPEQIQELGIDGRADQYALACVTYEMLTGAPLFKRTNVYLTLEAHVKDRPPTLTSRRPDLPFAADQVMAKALAKTPAGRYPSCADFADALRDALGLPPYYAGVPAQEPPTVFIPPLPPTTADEPGEHAPTLSQALTIGGLLAELPGAAEEAEEAEEGAPAQTPEAPAPEVIADAGMPTAPDDPDATAAPRLADDSETAPMPEAAATSAWEPVPASAWDRTEVIPDAAGHLSGPGTDALPEAPDVMPDAPAVPGTSDASEDEPDVHMDQPDAPGAPAVETPAPAPAGDWHRRLGLVAVAAAIIAAAVTIPFVLSSPPAPVQPQESHPHSSPATSPIIISRRPTRLALPSAFSGHAVSSITVSPTGTTLAIASTTETCLWDLAAKKCTVTLPGVWSVAFSHDGTTLAGSDDETGPDGGSNGVIRLWNAATGRQIGPTLTDPDSKGALSVAFGPHDATLAVGDRNGHTYLWNIAARTRIALSDPNGTGVNAVAFSPDGTLLAVADANGNAYVWNVATRKVIATLRDTGRVEGAYALAFSPDGKTLAVGDKNGHTYLWNVATKTMIHELTDANSEDGVFALAFSPNGQMLATGDYNGTTYLWSVPSGKPIAARANTQSNGVVSVAFSHDGATLVTGYEDGVVDSWSIS